jgi:hypothetical protein
MKFERIKVLHIHGDIYHITLNDLKVECEKSELRLIIEKIDNEII